MDAELELGGPRGSARKDAIHSKNFSYPQKSTRRAPSLASWISESGRERGRYSAYISSMSSA